MDANAIAAAVGESLPGVQIDVVPSVDLHSTFYVQPADLIPVLRTLRDHADLRFELLSEMTAADFWPREPRFEVIYILVSFEFRLRARLKVRLPAEDPHLDTATVLWPAANWLEREIWDMFGIAFDGHPDPRRLLMPEDWDGFPARKDYPVQIQMTPVSASATQVTEEEFRANLMKDRLARK
ncbi:MAG TPA: NADH-quinone oxidoreductase subunit C [Vicinamibacterales bacterium]|nr:NADH-quinone oxidoreductase subunit C [Vicinamibacterales bacterium]